jgi:hypothetical protein
MHPTLRPAAILAAALALGSCGGGSEREGLRAYEASVEKLMEEDGRVAARLDDFREDLRTANSSTGEMVEYSKSVAAPFYARFREAAAKAPAEAERLAKVHEGLLEYLDHRIAYLAAIEKILDSQSGGGMDRLRKAQTAWEGAVGELAEKTQGQLSDPGAADAINRRAKFMKFKYEAFLAGKIPVEEVEEALRTDVLPRLQAVADRTKGDLAAEGVPGALARWSAAELAFFQQLAAGLPLQAGVQKTARASQAAWDGAAEARERYVSGLRAYRDSLR